MLAMRRTIGAKGQIVLPKDIRDQFNLREGSEVVFTVREDEIGLRPAVSANAFIKAFCTPSIPKISMKDLKKRLEERYAR